MAYSNDVIVIRKDLSAVRVEDGLLHIDGIEFAAESDPDDLRQIGLQYLSAAEYINAVQAKKAAKEAKEWEREHAVPLARLMHDNFHRYSDNYRDDTDPDVWLSNYDSGNFTVMKWVGTAASVLKAQETDA